MAHPGIIFRSRTLRHGLCLIMLAAVGGLAGCYQRTQSAVINPDGSGKMVVTTVVAVPAQAPPGRQKPTAISFGKQVAAQIINTTLGVDAWSDLSIEAVDADHAQITVTAYFKDINKLHFDMPLKFVWTPDNGGAGATLSVQRDRTELKSYNNLTDQDLAKLVSQAQDQFKGQQAALQTQLSVFSLDMSFELPGEVTQTTLFARDGNKVSITLDGKKAMDALNKFMADDKALGATFRAGEDSQANDDILLDSMYGKKGPVAARVKFTPATTQPNSLPKDAFDYRTELKVAQLKQADMLKEAGVELIPKFIVNDTDPAPATAPASRPATRPAGRGG